MSFFTRSLSLFIMTFCLGLQFTYAGEVGEEPSGDGGPSADVEVLVDGKPRVSNIRKSIRDLYDPTQMKVLEPPHFHFHLSVRNNSEKTLVLTSFRIEVFTQEDSADKPSATSEFSPSDCLLKKVLIPVSFMI